MPDCRNIAAIIHADMCEDDRNGYSWEPRWGGDHPDGYKTLRIEGREYGYWLGSYDCSSSLITAWRQALRYTPYEGALDGATFTGDMRAVFEASGLFYSEDSSNRRGDIYLADSSHTAMCQDGGSEGVFGYDAMSQFSINENGEVYGGYVGDQTGREAYITYYSDHPWDANLHYNGGADGDGPRRGDGVAVSRRYEIVDAVRSQVGQPYYSMNYGAAEGYAGWMGTHYVDAGWGCAQLAAFSYNSVIGTHYVGSSYNFAGDALGQGTDQGGGQFVFTDEPMPGDVVVYILAGHDGADYSDYGHTAIYTGDGMAVGALGTGTPGSGGYVNIGVMETGVSEQDLGGGWRYLRCTLPMETTIDESEDGMECIFRPNEENYLIFYDGTDLHPLKHPHEVDAIKTVYRQTHNGREIPMFELGSPDAPWATRFIQAVQHKMD